MTKTDRVFNALLTGKSFNRFEAARLLHDTCIHSTVATLEGKHRMIINRKFEQVPCFGGNKTNVKRYWIAPDEIQRIKNRRQMLGKEKAQPSDQTREGFSK